ncbi:MFS-type transporter involved in bile tolerance (Atg22 family) [Paracandidimonas soli]|uniref:MFS-type transporter involved in bile tolerance (Atg22 family) n=1 Tax=Paracandidimonas soli TaxID=1917182 RepID=A0A4R3VAH2_9BURK|nr:MFS-type transporter involved in bile tolerance (Atg22 family) [Paracandidimonas soli]
MPVIPLSHPATSGRPESVYRLPGFAAFLFARLATVFAMQIQAIVVAWQVYDITRDPMSLAYAGLAQFLPMLLLLAPAGDLIDRYNRKAILSASWALSAICSALLAWLSYSDAHPVGGIYAVLVLFGCARAFMAPSLQSLLPQIVPRERLAQSLATNSMIMKIGTIGGPVAGGALYAFGGPVAYLVCLVCFLGGIVLLRRVQLLHAQQMAQAGAGNKPLGIWQRFNEGIRFIWSHPIVLGAISLDLFAVLLGGVVALLPIYAQDILHVGPTGLGLLRSAMAVGEILTGLYLSTRPFNRRVGRTLFCAIFLFGGANLVFAFSTAFWLSFVALVVAGAGDMVNVYVRGALVQYSTPDYLRGRVNAVNMLFISSSNELGEFRAGSTAAAFGAVPAAAMGACFTLLIAGGMMWRVKELRNVDRFEDAAHAR